MVGKRSVGGGGTAVLRLRRIGSWADPGVVIGSTKSKVSTPPPAAAALDSLVRRQRRRQHQPPPLFLLLALLTMATTTRQLLLRLQRVAGGSSTSNSYHDCYFIAGCSAWMIAPTATTSATSRTAGTFVTRTFTSAAEEQQRRRHGHRSGHEFLALPVRSSSSRYSITTTTTTSLRGGTTAALAASSSSSDSSEVVSPSSSSGGANNGRVDGSAQQQKGGGGGIDADRNARQQQQQQRRKRILSGVQPTGNIHLGNYLGAIRQWVEFQENDSDGNGSDESFFCVVDMHAITVPHDPVTLAESTRTVAALYLAAGTCVCVHIRVGHLRRVVSCRAHSSQLVLLCWSCCWTRSSNVDWIVCSPTLPLLCVVLAFAKYVCPCQRAYCRGLVVAMHGLLSL
jgi:tRNA synthetases class I (W and Y)